MPESTTVGAIAVEVIANTGKLEKGMAGASATIDNFSNTAASSLDRYKQALTKIEFGGRAAKKSLKEVGMAVGAGGGDFASAAVSMLAMGPAVGAAIAGMHIFNHVMQ